jgi:serpin B
MSNLRRCVGAALLAAILGASCSSGSSGHAASTPPSGVQLIGAARAQPTSSLAALRAAARGEQQFALQLYRELAAASGNFAIAPSSIAMVLGMIEAGARGATAQQIADALHVALPATEQAGAIGGLARSFAARTGQGVTLDEVDQAWLQQGRSVLTPYADTLAGPFSAPLATIDFRQPDAAAAAINKWFGDNTHGKIKKVIDASDLVSAALVLTDAVYLDAQWAHGFDPKQTAPAPFHLADGRVENVPTMHLDSSSIHRGPGLGYADGPGWKAVSLPYQGNQLEMDVIVPDDLHAFEATLDAGGLSALLAALEPANVMLSLPKFDSNTESDLVEPLKELGIRDVFDPTKADLSGIDGRPDLVVSDVKHEVVVHVDEQGTVAAAATAGVLVPLAAPVETVVQVDQPFVYVVRDRTTGAILFLGRVTDPQA